MAYEAMETDCRACGDMHGEPMTYCGAFLTPHQVDMTDEAHSIDGSDTESIDSEMSEPLPIPPPLVRRAAVEQPLSVREQEIQYIETHGLVAFCHGAVFTAILQDADYLRAQLTYLGK
jgi:hypothetical protein